MDPLSTTLNKIEYYLPKDTEPANNIDPKSKQLLKLFALKMGFNDEQILFSFEQNWGKKAIIINEKSCLPTFDNLLDEQCKKHNVKMVSDIESIQKITNLIEQTPSIEHSQLLSHLLYFLEDKHVKGELAQEIFQLLCDIPYAFWPADHRLHHILHKEQLLRGIAKIIKESKAKVILDKIDRLLQGSQFGEQDWQCYIVRGRDFEKLECYNSNGNQNQKTYGQLMHQAAWTTSHFLENQKPDFTKLLKFASFQRRLIAIKLDYSDPKDFGELRQYTLKKETIIYQDYLSTHCKLAYRSLGTVLKDIYFKLRTGELCSDKAVLSSASDITGKGFKKIGRINGEAIILSNINILDHEVVPSGTFDTKKTILSHLKMIFKIQVYSYIHYFSKTKSNIVKKILSALKYICRIFFKYTNRIFEKNYRINRERDILLDINNYSYEVTIDHTRCIEIDKILKHSEDLYNTLLRMEVKNEKDKEQILKVSGEFYWWFCEAKPFKRGDPSIAEIMLRAVWKIKGLNNLPWQEGIISWAETVKALDPIEFGENFHRLFEGNF